MNFENPRHLVAAAQKIRSEYLKKANTTPISVSQSESLKETPVQGPIWVSKFVAPRPEEDSSRDQLLAHVDEANDKHAPYDRPESEPLHLEWTGFRGNVHRNTPEPLISEKQKFQSLEAETKSPLTILYVYGGTFTYVICKPYYRLVQELINGRLNTPSTYRYSVGKLAQATGSKVLMVRQRLAPQNPFPAALLDVFQTYLSLLAPPTGSPHKATAPSSIVVTGDSSGACLALALLQILLRLQRRNETIIFHGKRVEPALPAGMAFLSPVADLSNAFPSFETHKDWDLFPVPIEKMPYLQKSFPTCAIWPTRPPRANLYCDAGMLSHPLASPAACDDWTGACPLWFASGQEQISDSQRMVAQTAHQQGVSVTLHEYEKMPHVFFWYLRQAPQAQKVFKDWMRVVVAFGKGEKPPSSAYLFYAKGLVAKKLDVADLVQFTPAEARTLMWEKSLGYKVPSFHKDERALL